MSLILFGSEEEGLEVGVAIFDGAGELYQELSYTYTPTVNIRAAGEFSATLLIGGNVDTRVRVIPGQSA
jgi:hypothetical protein